MSALLSLLPQICLDAMLVSCPHDTLPQEERVLPRVPFGACVDAWGSDEEMGDYHSAYLGRRTTARRSSRIVSFPPFLMVQLKRCAAACL